MTEKMSSFLDNIVKQNDQFGDHAWGEDFKEDQKFLVHQYLDQVNIPEKDKWSLAGRWIRQYGAEVVAEVFRELHGKDKLGDINGNPVAFLGQCLSTFAKKQKGKKRSDNTCDMLDGGSCNCDHPEPIRKDGELLLGVDNHGKPNAKHTWMR